MKKFTKKHLLTIILTATVLLGGTLTAWGASTLGPLYGGTNTYGEYVPLEGNYADYYQRVQVIYPKEDLTKLAGNNITKMSFYLRTKATKAWGATIEVALAEVDDANFDASTSFLSSSFTTVYSGTSLNGMGDLMEISFSTPFTYSGDKNLLFELRVTGKGAYSKTIFAAKGGYDNYFCIYKNSSSSYSSMTTGTRRYARPKTLFTYEEATTSSCTKPGTPVASDITATSAKLTWTAAEGVTNYQFVRVAKGETPDWTGVTPQAVTTITYNDLTKFTDYDFYVRSYCGAGDGEQSAAEKVSFKTLKSCYEPTSLSVVEAEITSSGAKITWSASGHGETQWQYTYEVFDDEIPNWTSATVTDETEATLSGLAPSTPYQVWVRSYCGAGDQSEAITAYFTTDCAATSSVGFEENFENATSGLGNLPDCWKSIGGNYPYVRNATAYAHNGSKFIYFYGGVTGTSEQIAILPAFTEATSSLTISLYYRNAYYAVYTGDSYGSISVGYMTDPTSASSFVAKKTLAKKDSYTEESVDMTGAPAGARIAIRYTGGATAGESVVDDIVVSQTPSCFKPASVTVNSSTYNGVNFSWTESGHGETQWQYAVVAAGATPSSWSDATSTKSASVSGLTTGSSYEVCVRSYCGPSDQSELTRSASFIPTCQAPSGVTVSAITNNSASVNWTANNGESTWNLQYRKGTGSWTTKSNITKPYALTGLDANSTYEVKVACAEGCTSGYSTAASFKTKCDAIAEAELPYENNFESATTYKLPSCWDKIGSGDYPQVLSGSAAYGGSGKCLGFYGNSMQTAILPGFETAINKLMITFHYRHSYSDVQIGYVKANGDFVPKETLPTRSAYNEVSPYEVEMSDWGDEAVYIAFCMANTTSSYANAYIDNVKVEKAPTCFKPAGWDNANTTIGANSATIAWTAPAKNESQYQYICVPSGETPDWDSEDAHLTSSRNATIDNLQPASAYDFYVRSYCAADDQSEIISKSFSTTCGTFTLTDDSPFEYDFEGGTWGQTPTCWTTHYASGYHAYFSNGSAHTGSKALDVLASKNTGSETFVVLPKLSMALNKLAISFYYKGTAGATIQVGYMTDKDNKGTFTAVGAALTASASYQLGAVSFASVSADAYIAIRFKGNTGDGDFYIDDVRVARTELFTDGEDNFQTRLTGLADQTLDVLMTRPLQFDGYYSTLCLPFDLSAEQLADADCPLYNFTIKYFDYVEVQNEELIISIAPTGTITAGVPYFVMANAASYDKPLLFRDVTISAATPAYKVSEGVKYQGVFNNVGLAAQTENDTHDIIYLGRGNQLYWPDAAVTVKGFRAYFNADTSGPNNSPIHRGMKLSFGEGHGTTTAIERIGTDADGVRKVLENGRIIIIRDGKRYSVMGQVIE